MTKPLIGASGSDLPAPTDKIDFAKMMCVYSHKRDKAVGSRLSKHTRGLVWYGETKQRELNKALLQAAVTKGAMDKIRTRMKEIMQEAETSQLDDARKQELLAEARMLQKTARRVSKNGLH